MTGNFLGFAQTSRLSVSAYRINEPIKLDGKLNEVAWAKAPKVKDFIQAEPIVGANPTHQTEAFVLYDDNAIYIGARMFDSDPTKILKELSLRDQIGNADNFRVFFDPYMSGINGFKFYVTSSGVQYEASVSNHIDDSNWNAVWQSEVSFDDNGWFVEIKIPYASLRFPSKDVQTWGLQIGREVRRLREVSYWSPIDPAISGWVQQSGIVTGINNIKSPIRLSLTPYVSGYLNTVYDPNVVKSERLAASPSYSAGLDLKYGVNDAFTLDMTLVPDFGQVISDRQVLNLSPFEIFFEDNRQFFTESTELFNKGRLFYSRRIGGRPLKYFNAINNANPGETLIDNPDVTQLYNATKISGRTSNGTGLGGFNAVVGESFATYQTASDGSTRKVLTNPLTNYSTIVVDQNLKNNSYVSLTNTNVMRRGSDYDANVTGAFTNMLTPDQKYNLQASAVASQLYFSDSIDVGYSYSIVAGKVSGNWTYNLRHVAESNNYNPNDLGFLFSPNERLYSGEVKYAQYKPRNPKLQQYSITTNIAYERLFKPDVYVDHYTTINAFILRKTRFAYGFNGRLEPFTTYNYFEPRSADFSRFLAFPVNYLIGGFVSSDYRKAVAYDIRYNYRYFDADGRNNYSFSVGPRIRISDQFSFIFNMAYSLVTQEPGYVNRFFVDVPLTLKDDDILFGNRNRQIIENTLTGKFTFNAQMNLSLRVRHYWDKVIYQSFGPLDENGYVEQNSFNGLDELGQPIFDRNVNIFNIDLQYNWRFAPGSDIIIVWKNQINRIDDEYDSNYYGNIRGIFDSPQGNSLSVRAIYFLDYNEIISKKS